MCGIIGYIGVHHGAREVLLKGLKKLEYRGYDSAGLAYCDGGKNIIYKRAVGEVQNLAIKLKQQQGRTSLLESLEVGIAHTRWATHGKPLIKNAHPHKAGSIFVVHNGIIENYQELRDELKQKGRVFSSDTDSEVLTHLIDEEYKQCKVLDKSVAQALKRVQGAYAVVVMLAHNPEELVLARMSSPLLLGVSDDGYIVASDASAIIEYTKKVVYLDDGDIVVVKKSGYSFTNGSPKKEILIEWNEGKVEMEGFSHFMLKEIYEQPSSIADTLRGRLIEESGDVRLGGLSLVKDELKKIERLIIVACGTARCAGIAGEYMIEEFANIPVEVDYAHEFRYRKAPLSKNTAVLVISQSGETADTLAAVKEVKSKGALTLGIVNVVGSTIARETDAGIYNHAGPEMAVASTKAFTSQLSVLALMAVYLGRQRKMSIETGKEIIKGLQSLPRLVQQVLDTADEIKKVANKYAKYKDFFFLGRKYNFATALEGAIKLKELSYAHAEGEASGELKHGPLAMIDKDFPSIFIIPKDSMYEKTFSAIEEVCARGGRVLAIASKGDKKIKEIANDVLYIPNTLEMLTPILATVVLQLFAYYVAVKRGNNVDRPRNLAKSVTVE